MKGPTWSAVDTLLTGSGLTAGGYFGYSPVGTALLGPQAVPASACLLQAVGYQWYYHEPDSEPSTLAFGWFGQPLAVALPPFVNK